MARPSPISATRNWTIGETSVNWVRPRSSRKVVRMEQMAIAKGTKAISEAKTNARTSRAPTLPMTTSTNTPGPSLSSSPSASRS
jgi:hypothetical protein